MRNYLKEAKNIKKTNIRRYEYEYFTIDGENIVKNDEITQYFGNDREGFEKYKNENSDSHVSYSGETSLRTVTDRVSGSVIGYITEKEIKDNKHIEDVKLLYNKQKDEAIKALNIRDLVNFEYYIDIYLEDLEFSTTIDTYIRKINLLIELKENYESDIAFREFFKKIIG